MTTRNGLLALTLGGIGAVVALLTGLVLVLVILPSADNPGCDGSGPAAVLAGDPAGAGSDGLDAAQSANATTVVNQGMRLHIADRGIVVALATASQESGFRNYANDGRGGDLLFSQAGIAASLRLAHDAVGSDHGSLGIFQQQWPWWGTMHDLMTPAVAAAKFYHALSQVAGWETMPITLAAQAVQHSAYPTAYADDEPLARRLLAQLRATSQSTAQASWISDPAGCLDDGAGFGEAGGVVYPLPPTAHYVDLANWGGRGAHWAHGHTGTDLSVSCGTPVLAATAGTVIIRRDQPWAGPWLVQVSTGPGELTTWYAHMRDIRVYNGQHVTAGAQLGEVGDLGNATGCHLHFEVHLHGGSIYQDNVNPTTWLKNHVGRGHAVQPAFSLGDTSIGSGSVGGFVLASFNTLGAVHTAPGGNKPLMASGAQRTHGMVQILNHYAVDVVGFQEFEHPQDEVFQRLAGDAYDVWHPGRDTENSIAWRAARFRLVRAGSQRVRYFGGDIRHMPIVELQDRTTSAAFWVVNVHNPADTAKYHHQQPYRLADMATERDVIRRLLTATGQSVFLTGDMNEAHLAYCTLTAGGLLHAAAGGNHHRHCHPPAGYHGVDWILGTPGTNFTGHTVDRGTLVRHTTDHPVVLTRASTS
jgi:murein DD-endopeptidase MepM/ murein hydrolase activator NlpD